MSHRLMHPANRIWGTWQIRTRALRSWSRGGYRECGKPHVYYAERV